ncbi:hypothetical protein D9758_005430 [Tetrapyrgos nigripes]|uniref:Protein YOP1 n=1 Tax=Tetrapyrgos nigripes TaxID=182062 RepID=A0A8H5GI73_9AGAR|nr:hypothetical protein D9758_005430 [Tetrapyrgos nigripes]
MLFWLLSITSGYLYPAYASYKSLSVRPASTPDIERWLMYWSILGVLTFLESTPPLSIFLSLIPLYSLFKLLFLLYLAAPQTQGSTYLFQTHLKPFLDEHEAKIDRTMEEVRAKVWGYIQEWGKNIWDTLVQSAFGAQAASAQAPVAPPTPPHPPPAGSGPVQLMSGFWRSYGPTVLTTGAALWNQMSQAAASGNQVQRPHPTTYSSGFSTAPSSSATRGYDLDSDDGTTAPSPRPSASRASTLTTQSIIERRRQLEAELAALQNMEQEIPSGLPSPGASSYASSTIPSPGRDMGGYLRERTGSNSSVFEEIRAESDEQGHEYPRPQQAQRGSWFGWGSGGSGYDRVKND